jgi:hypothetical protein
MKKFSPKQQAAFDKLSSEGQAAIQKMMYEGDRKTIVFMGAAMGIMSAVNAHSAKQITKEQVYDIVQCALQFIWCTCTNEVGEKLLREEAPEDMRKFIAMLLYHGIPAEQKAAERLYLLVETLCKPTTEKE